MVSSSETAQKRGFIPPRDDDERFVMRRAEDLYRTALARSMPRHSGFLSDREQDLCAAALNRCGCREYSFQGGWSGAERKVLCLHPAAALWQEQPVQCISVTVRLSADAAAPEHKDYLGALMGLEIERGCLGDILPEPDLPGHAYLFVLEDKVDFICRELTEIGKFRAQAEPCSADAVQLLPQPERQIKTGTVPSLRLDAVLAEVIGTGRGTAAEIIAAGRVEVNHIREIRAHAPVYAEDTFTVRGKGKYRLCGIVGKSKKDRVIIEYFQF